MKEKSIQELAREERLKYFREWRKKNPDKVKACNQRYWENRARERQNQAQGGE